MKKAWTAAVFVTAMGILASVAGAQTRPAARTAQDDNTAAMVKAINSAQDPSAAVQAYADAMAGGRKDLKVQRAYIRKMVDLGSPEMAYSQALTMVALDPNNGLAWAVIAYVSARKGEAAAALSNISLAAQNFPDDPFIQRTAAQLIAWYDSKPHPELAEGVKLLVARLRARMVNMPVYAQAYKETMAAYNELTKQQGQPPAASQPAQVAGNQGVGPAGQQQPGDMGIGGYYGYPLYPFWGGGWGWPWWGGNDFFFRHHGRDCGAWSSIWLADGSVIPFRDGQTILFSNGQPFAVVGPNGRFWGWGDGGGRSHHGEGNRDGRSHGGEGSHGGAGADTNALSPEMNVASARSHTAASGMNILIGNHSEPRSKHNGILFSGSSGYLAIQVRDPFGRSLGASAWGRAGTSLGRSSQVFNFTGSTFGGPSRTISAGAGVAPNIVAGRIVGGGFGGVLNATPSMTVGDGGFAGGRLGVR
ncbi:MAG: hypothetical protein ACE15C_02670 [Phycisphaerae bacterium]